MHIFRHKPKLFLPNRIIWYLTFSDIFSWGSLFALSTLLGIFLSHKLEANVESVIGIGAGIYLTSRSISQIVVGQIADKLTTKYDEIVFMVGGAGLVGIPYMLYPFITESWHYFGLQVIIGLGVAMNLIGWRKLFSWNLDPHNEGMDYGIYDSVFSLASAMLSVTIGLLANQSVLHFNLVVLFVGASICLSGVWALFVGMELNKHRQLAHN